jgi:uncharacterized phage protein gp47/JayE
MTTNVPQIAFTPTGLVIPAESEVLAGVQADYNNAFGGNLNPALNTPQGQLASSTAAVISDSNDQFALFVNQVNPDTAAGFMQDAIGRIYFLDRSPGAPTVVQCLCTGQFGTVIPIGAQAQDTSGNRYACTAAGTIPFGGSITLPFANVEVGPIACPANTLTSIYKAIPGWDTINNPTDGAIGRNVETQAEFAYRRQQSVALNARGSLPSIYAAVFDVPDVLDVYVYENVTNGTITVGATNFPLVAHSLYVAAVGGNSEAIAQAIWSKKDVGCNYNGNTTVVIEDTSGYDPPRPQYNVTFEIPPSLPIKFAVQIADSPDLPANIVALTKAAIVATFNGTFPGTTRVRIGSLLLASKFYPAVIAIGPEVSVLSILLGSATATLTSQLIGIDQAPTLDPTDIDVVLV